MFWTPNKSMCINALLVILICTQISLSDAIIEKDSVTYGEVISEGKKTVVFSAGCEGKTILYLSRKQLSRKKIRIERNGFCKPPSKSVPNSTTLVKTVPKCPVAQEKFRIWFKNGEVVYASDAISSIEGDKLIISVAHSNEIINSSFEDISSVDHIDTRCS